MLVRRLRYGVRSLLRTPLFSLLAVVTLALGIGANAAVFGVVKSLLLDALPYADADRLVRVYTRFLDGSYERAPLSQGTLRDEARGASESRRTRHLRGMLVAGQIALCVSLLAGAGLLARSLSPSPRCT